MAQYADECNLTSGPARRSRTSSRCSAGHCADVGRDPATINKTWLASAIVGSTPAEAEANRDRLLRARGLDWGALDGATRQALTARILIGTPEAIAAEVEEAALAVGLDGVILNFPANGADADAIGAAGSRAAHVVRSVTGRAVHPGMAVPARAGLVRLSNQLGRSR